MSAEAMVKAAFCADAVSLGPHWVYDQEEIQRSIGRSDRLHDPISNYHPGKQAGDLTHYGDQMLVLLRHLASAGRFELEAFAADWKAYWEDPSTISYRDAATRGTLESLGKGVPAGEAAVENHDLAGASLTAPLFLLKWESDAELVAASRRLASFSHRDANVEGAAEFFTLLCLALRRGDTISEAFEKNSGELVEHRYDGLDLDRWLVAAKGSARSQEEDGSILAEHGLGCDVDGAFAGVCHLLLRYPKDPVTALVENAAAGGDSAARGLILGMVYGAAGLADALPAAWWDGLRCKGEVGNHLAAFR